MNTRKTSSLSSKGKKILLINPPRYEVIPEYIEKGIFYKTWLTYSQPAGLLRIGTHLREHGHDVSLINCGMLPVESTTPCAAFTKRRCGVKNLFNPLYHIGLDFFSFEKQLRQSEAEEILITSFFTYQWEPIHKIIQICKKILPKSKITLGGTYATLCPDHAKTSKADFVYSGEFQNADPCFSSLDLLGKKPNFAILKFSRGCPFRCSYCAVPLLEGRHLRFRTVQNIIEEIQQKVNSLQIKKFIFWESQALINVPFFLELMSAIAKLRLDLTLVFPEGFSPRLLTYDILEVMKTAGVKSLYLALESSSDSVLRKRFHKTSDFSDFREIAASIRRIDFFKCVFVFILAGMPNQKLHEIRRSIQSVTDMGFLPYLQPFTPIPGTEEYKNCSSSIKNRGLEELHPLLWPCVTSTKEYDALTKIHADILKSIKSFIVAKERLYSAPME